MKEPAQRKTSPPMAPGVFRYGRRVQFAETDLAGIVHFSSYFKYMEEAEHALFRAAGLSVARDGLHWPRIAASCEFRQPLRFEDEIDVWVRAGFGRRRMEYGFEIYRGDARSGQSRLSVPPIATGAMTSVCARLESGVLQTIDLPLDVVERLRNVLLSGAAGT